MNITFKFVNASLDLSARVASYKVYREVSSAKTLTTMDSTEHTFGTTSRVVLEVSFWPMTEAESTALYDACRGIVSIQYTDPYSVGDSNMAFKLSTNLESTFALVSVDGMRRYKGGTLTFRAVTASAYN